MPGSRPVRSSWWLEAFHVTVWPWMGLASETRTELGSNEWLAAVRYSMVSAAVERTVWVVGRHFEGRNGLEAKVDGEGGGVLPLAGC